MEGNKGQSLGHPCLVSLVPKCDILGGSEGSSEVEGQGGIHLSISESLL